MSKILLKRYIKMVMEDVTRPAPNQLLSPEQADEDSGTEEASEIDEFSGAGAVAGYTAPLGINPDKLNRKKNKRG
jgi:hypothetical protein